jgi:hypothetical protein
MEGKKDDGLAAEVQAAVHPALLGHPPDPAQQAFTGWTRWTPTTRSWSRRSPCAASRPAGWPAPTPTSTSRASTSRSKAPVARIEMEVKLKSGGSSASSRLEFRDDLFVESGGLDQYRASRQPRSTPSTTRSSFTNGVVLAGWRGHGDVTERDIRRIQIREAIKAHLRQGKAAVRQGIKVLSLFFIDEVAKYRDYDQADEQPGEYARIFEEEYELLKDEYLSELRSITRRTGSTWASSRPRPTTATSRSTRRPTASSRPKVGAARGRSIPTTSTPTT